MVSTATEGEDNTQACHECLLIEGQLSSHRDEQHVNQKYIERTKEHTLIRVGNVPKLLEIRYEKMEAFLSIKNDIFKQ